MTDHSHHSHTDTHDHQMTDTHGPAENEASQAAHHGHAGGGHDKHAGHSVAMFRDRFWLSLLLTLPVVFYSEMIQDWFGYAAPSFPGSDWIAPVLGTVIFVYGGSPFLKGAVQEARDRQPGMMLLIGMAITVAFVASAATTLGWFDLDFWWELAALITIMLLGHWMEMRAIGQARGALAALAELLPDEAERVTDGETETISVADLRVDDVVLVRPGARVPADGDIVSGEVEMDESMVTGESKPVPKGEGDHVVAGTVATDSSIRVRVTAVGEDTALAGIQRLVAQAQESRSRAQVLADRAAALLFYVAVAAAVVTVIAWTIVGQPDQAVVRTVAVLVIACPHALGLAIPLVIAISTSMAARNGILVKDRLALERMRTVDVVLFDKTGTLTKGSHRLTGLATIDGDDDRVLATAAAVESDSEHPLARAIVTAAKERGQIPTASGFKSMSGRGVEADVDGSKVAVGGPTMLAERTLEVPSALDTSVQEWKRRGAAVLYVIENDRVTGAFSVEDEVRAESRQAIDELHKLGVKVAMITGDARQVADAVAAELDIDQVLAEVLPEDKHSEVEKLQQQAQRVAMVGDGVNDAPALAQADVGIAIGAGTDVAIESAGIVLASDDPRGVVAIHRLSKAGYRKMLQNLAWATGYNVIAIPLAAGALAWAGIVLAPAAAAVLMSASTVIVAINAQFLRRLQLRPST
ncbi:MAG TPA: heavy metal translocating P-type ATPase [Acidimicrobiia bacterium]|nr:heavy metal translocating P-type ATPase [Acidimicrobiia bacterium]